MPLKWGGGFHAITYTVRMANRVGWLRLWKAMRARNACKTCALGMGGQLGGMRNEQGHWPEVCKKSLQAMVGDMQGAVRPEFFSQFSIAQLRGLSSSELEHCGRLTQPIIAGPNDTHFRPIGWDEAITSLGERLARSGPNRSFFYASGRSSNEAAFLLQLFGRLFGTNYINNCSYYCHQASGVGLTRSLGTGTATVTLEDVENSELFVLIGGNPASNHPRLLRSLMIIRRRGGRVIVINPAKELGLVRFKVPSDIRSLLFGTKIADLYIQPHIGGDIALLMGIAKTVLQRGAVAHSFVENHTTGFSEFKLMLEKTGWADIESHSGVPRETIEQIAEMYCSAKNAVFGWTMGITQHTHGVGNVQSIVNLALLRGMVGRPNAGLLPIRGHSNVQGIGSMGVTPKLKKKILDRLEELLEIKLPDSPGLDTMGCMKAAHQGKMNAALCLGGNLYGSNPDSSFSSEALGKLDFITYLSTSLNTGHVHGRANETLILPVCARDEESQPTTQESMFNFVRMSDGGPARHAGPRTEVSIITDLARQPGFLDKPGFSFLSEMTDHTKIRHWIARSVPGYEQIEKIDETKSEFQIDGRTFHEPSFPTTDGKAKFVWHDLPDLQPTDGQLRLMTVRSEGQFNTVVYEEQDVYRGQDRRDVILLNEQDMVERGLKENQPVSVQSEAGIMRDILARPFDIRPGNAVMYYPEANVLVPTTTDPDSRTPAFKSVIVTLIPELISRGQNP